jgi:hypothetical protein
VTPLAVSQGYAARLKLHFISVPSSQNCRFENVSIQLQRSLCCVTRSVVFLLVQCRCTTISSVYISFPRLLVQSRPLRVDRSSHLALMASSVYKVLESQLRVMEGATGFIRVNLGMSWCVVSDAMEARGESTLGERVCSPCGGAHNPSQRTDFIHIFPEVVVHCASI